MRRPRSRLSLLRFASAKASSTQIDQFRRAGHLCFSQSDKIVGAVAARTTAPELLGGAREWNSGKCNAGSRCKSRSVVLASWATRALFFGKNPNLANALVAEGFWDVTQFICPT